MIEINEQEIQSIVPDGYEAVSIRAPRKGDLYLESWGAVVVACGDFGKDGIRVILKRKRWVPSIGEMYYYLDRLDRMEARGDRNHGCWIDQVRIDSGNCFRTREESQHAAEKTRELWLSLHEEGE